MSSDMIRKSFKDEDFMSGECIVIFYIHRSFFKTFFSFFCFDTGFCVYRRLCAGFGPNVFGRLETNRVG